MLCFPGGTIMFRLRGGKTLINIEDLYYWYGVWQAEAMPTFES